MGFQSMQDVDWILDALEDGSLSPEDEQQALSLLSDAAPVIDAYEMRQQSQQKFAQNSMKRNANKAFSALNDDQKAMFANFLAADEQAAEASKVIRSAQSGAEWDGIVSGFKRGLNNIWTNVADFLGEDELATEAAKRGKDYSEFALKNAKIGYEEALGRELSPGEMEWVAEKVKGMETAGQFASELAVTAPLGLGTAQLMRVKGLFSGILMGAGEGAIAGSAIADASSEDAEERAESRKAMAALGGGIGGVVGLVPGATATIKHWIGKPFDKALKAKDQLGRTGDDLRALAEEWGVDLSAVQSTLGNPRIAGMADPTRGAQATELFRTQQQQVVSGLSKKMGWGIKQLDEMNTSVYSDVQRVHTVFKDIAKDIRGQRQANWKKGQAELRSMEGYDDVRFVTELPNLNAAIDDVVSQLEVFGHVGKDGYSAVIGDTLKNFIIRARSKQGVSTAELDDMLTKLSNWVSEPSASGAIRKLPGADTVAADNKMAARLNELRKGLNKDIDQIKVNPDDAAGNSLLGKVRSHRDQWEADSEFLNAMEEAVFSKMGGNSLMTNINAIPEDKIKILADRLRSMEGGGQLLDDVNATAFRSAVFDAMVAGKTRGGQQGVLDIKVLTERLAQTAERAGATGLMAPAQAKTMRDGITVMRQIMSEPAATGGVLSHRVVNGLDNIAINLISRDPGFVARLLGATMSRGEGAEWFFYTKEGVEALKAMAPQWRAYGKSSVMRNSAITALATSLDAAGQRKMYENWLKEEEQNAQMGQKQ